VLNRLMKPFGMSVDTDFKRFDEQCNGMMNELLIGDESHVIKYFKQLDILAIQRGYSTFPRKPKGSGKEDEQEEDEQKEDEQEEDNWRSNEKITKGRERPTTSTPQTTDQQQTEKVTKKRDRPTKSQTLMQNNSMMEEYYFRLEGAFQYMTRLCLDVCKVGRVNYEREFSAGRNDVEYVMPKLSKILLYETKAGVKDVKKALNQLLQGYARAYLNNGRNLICIAVSFSVKTRLIEDWIYVEYDEKGKILKFFSLKGHDVNKISLYDISIP